MTMKYILLFSYIFNVLLINAQRISTGLNLGTPLFHKTNLNDNFLFPKNSYFIYYTANSDKENKPVWDQYVNGYSVGGNLNVDYKRHMLSLEVLFSSLTYRIPVLYRSYVGALLDQNWSTLETVKQSMNYNVVYNFKFLTTANGFMGQIGGQYAYTTYFENNKKLESSVSPAINLWLSNNEFYEILYKQNPHHLGVILGLGYKYNNQFLSMRHTIPIYYNITDKPQASFFSIEALYAITLNFQKVKKGHKIYVQD
jgi:hypothetical protein